jgi:alkylresorcinol/alkylpyrone synthase
MTSIIAAASGFPVHYYSQSEITSVLKKYWKDGHSNIGRLERIHENTQVEGRHLALPLEVYDDLSTFSQSNQAWIKHALNLGEETLKKLMDKAGIAPTELSLLAFTTITGIAVPSIDARLMNRIPFSSHMKRMPIFGLGCLGGAAGIARVSDYLRGHPHQAAVLLSIELCSLTLQRQDLSIENIVASGLFGDGAAAVLLAGKDHPSAKNGKPQVIDTASIFFPDTEHVMGWDVRDSGLKVVLSSDVSDIAGRELRPAVEKFLSAHRLSIPDIAYWISHPGGPKVMEAIEDSLNLAPSALQFSRESLRKVGNISSASVLLVLEETLSRCSPRQGEYGLMLAMGPAFSAELVLIQW